MAGRAASVCCTRVGDARQVWPQAQAVRRSGPRVARPGRAACAAELHTGAAAGVGLLVREVEDPSSRRWASHFIPGGLALTRRGRGISILAYT